MNAENLETGRDLPISTGLKGVLLIEIVFLYCVLRLVLPQVPVGVAYVFEGPDAGSWVYYALRQEAHGVSTGRGHIQG